MIVPRRRVWILALDWQYGEFVDLLLALARSCAIFILPIAWIALFPQIGNGTSSSVTCVLRQYLGQEGDLEMQAFSNKKVV